MKRKTNVELLAEILGIESDRFGEKFGEKSESWATIMNKDFAITFVFDGDGQKFEKLLLSERVWDVVDEKLISENNYEI